MDREIESNVEVLNNNALITALFLTCTLSEVVDIRAIEKTFILSLFCIAIFSQTVCLFAGVELCFVLAHVKMHPSVQGRLEGYDLFCRHYMFKHGEVISGLSFMGGLVFTLLGYGMIMFEERNADTAGVVILSSCSIVGLLLMVIIFKVVGGFVTDLDNLIPVAPEEDPPAQHSTAATQGEVLASPTVTCSATASAIAPVTANAPATTTNVEPVFVKELQLITSDSAKSCGSFPARGMIHSAKSCIKLASTRSACLINRNTNIKLTSKGTLQRASSS
jgi:hypothetical protein